MAISRHGGKPGDSVGTNEIVDFAALNICTAKVVAQSCVSRTRPSLGYTRRQVLRISSHVEGGYGIAPDFPGCFGFPQPLQKPGFLFGAENGLRRLIPAEIRNLGAGIADGGWRVAAVVSATRIEYFHGFLRHECRKVVGCKGFGFGSTRGLLGAITALVSDDQFYVAAPAQCSITL